MQIRRIRGRTYTFHRHNEVFSHDRQSGAGTATLHYFGGSAPPRKDGCAIGY
jgi:hypothetical protein